MKHKDSGYRCLVAHYRNGQMQPACMQCDSCGGWITWDAVDGECPFDPDAKPDACTHKWEVRAWASPKHIPNAKQMERCSTCHTERTVPAQQDGTVTP